MSLHSITLAPDQCQTWIKILEDVGINVGVDEDEMCRVQPSPKVREVVYIIRLKQKWLRVLFSHRWEDSRSVLTFLTYERGCSSSLAQIAAEAIQGEA